MLLVKLSKGKHQVRLSVKRITFYEVFYVREISFKEALLS